MQNRFLKILCLSIIAVVFVAGCGKKEEATPPPLVRTQQISTKNNIDGFTYAGSVHGRYETNLSFQVSGKILRRNVQTGDRVHAGDTLMVMDNKDIIQQVNQSNAKVEAASSELNLAAANLKRYQQLYAQDAVPQAQLDQYQTSYDSASAAYQQAEAQSSQEHNALSYTDLTADTDGVISAINAEAGQVVSAGQTVLTLVQTNELEVDVNIPENHIDDVSEGKKVTVSFWALNNSSVNGIVREISPIADATARTYLIKISLPDPPAGLKLGMTASVICLPSDNSDKTSYILPLSAIYQTGDTPEVWLVDKDDKVSLQKVQVADFDENHVKVSGLNEGDMVVTAGVQKLREGQKVRTNDDAVGDAS
ncbi:efflux RND transporter periplasmic adaptor subunit [Pectinatus frisingensis]|uniref:efflux RND transporter periplasmic adaptor subunit n=1 Tax=Pectinatus frisingensis TaxID=865 RepID=UPI0018C654BA|nr:efflux RND transporter periplasmic adaptor subunit [Pectinatus frisingensis]